MKLIIIICKYKESYDALKVIYKKVVSPFLWSLSFSKNVLPFGSSISLAAAAARSATVTARITAMGNERGPLSHRVGGAVRHTLSVLRAAARAHIDLTAAPLAHYLLIRDSPYGDVRVLEIILSMVTNLM